jgi:uncharacterized protein YkwD
MLRFLVCAAALAVLAACSSQPKPAPAPPAASKERPAKPSAPARVKVSGLERELIDATNAYRREKGLETLKPSVKLISIAQGHARNMARQDKYGDSDRNGHVLDGKSADDRVKNGGYDFSRLAENVGYQHNRPDPAASMMDGWKKSRGHRKNMLLPDVTELGIGAAQGKSGRWYFVQIFGLPATSAKQASTY